MLFVSGCSKEPAAVIPSVSAASLDRAVASIIETSRQAVVTAPRSGEAWGRLGIALHASEFFREARTCYLRAGELDPPSARWIYLLGLLELQEQPGAAIQHFKRATELAGGQTDAPRLSLARALIEHGRFDEAQPHLQTLLAANPNHAAARVELARVHLARNALNDAAQVLQPALTNVLTTRPALLLLAQVQQRQNNAEAAAQLSRRAASMPRPLDWPDPYLREVHSLRADRQRLAEQANGFIQQQRTKEGEAALTKLLTAFPDDPEGLLLMGRLRYVERNCAEAEQWYQRHLQVQANSLNGLIQLALALLCQQRWNDGAAVLERAIALKPDFAQAHSNLGYARSRSGDSAGAIRAYRDALRCNPGDANAHLALAEELLRAGNQAEASAELERAAGLNPNDPRIRQLRERVTAR